MVFSTDHLYKQENIIDNAPKLVLKINENTSIFIDSLQCIINENILIENEIARYNTSMYDNKRKTVLLNEDKTFNINITTPGSRFVSGIINKVKTNLSLENIVKFIITSFIKLIARIWREFEILCMNLVSKDSQIQRLHNKISKLGVDISYNEPMFTFTHITDCVSRTDLEDQLVGIFNEITSFINKFTSLKNPRDIENAINDFNNNSYDDEQNYDQIRGNLLGSNSYISAEEYGEALFKYFRNGSSVASANNIITPDQMRIRLEKWKTAPRLIRGYAKDKAKMEKAGNDLVSKLRSTNVDKYLTDVSVETVDLYSKLVNRYANRIKNTCNIFVLYFSARWEAAKDELATNKKILFKAAEYITKEGL